MSESDRIGLDDSLLRRIFVTLDEDPEVYVVCVSDKDVSLILEGLDALGERKEARAMSASLVDLVTRSNEVSA